jgi:hypothetical protein
MIRGNLITWKFRNGIEEERFARMGRRMLRTRNARGHMISHRDCPSGPVEATARFFAHTRHSRMAQVQYLQHRLLLCWGNTNPVIVQQHERSGNA